MNAELKKHWAVWPLKYWSITAFITIILLAFGFYGLEQMPKDEIQELMEACGEVDATERNIRYAERLMRSKSRPLAKLDEVSTAADLKKLKTNMKKLALHTALCSVCLGLREKGFSEERLGRIFDDVGSTRTKIENGEESYEELERRLENV